MADPPLIWRVFCVTGLGGLYLERLIHAGAYLRNFTVFPIKDTVFLQNYTPKLALTNHVA